MHFKDADGVFQEIDADLGASKGGKRSSKANDFVLEVADDANAASVANLRLDADHSVGFSLQGATAAKATAETDASTYDEVAKDTDLRLSSQPDGLKEELVLASPAAGLLFLFPLQLKGLTAAIDANGDVIYRDKAGVERARTPHGFMTDSAVDPLSDEAPMSLGVTYALVPNGKGTVLEVRLDKLWLNDPARVWPVIVDPQIAVATTDDTFVMSPFHQDNSTSLELKVGTHNGGGEVARSFMKFDTGAITGKTISWAQLHIAERHSYNCSSAWPTIHRVTESWTGSQMQDWPGKAFETNPAGGVVSANGACHGRTVVYDVTSAAAHWAANSGQSYGLALNTSITDSNQWKKFASSETGAPPALHVNWTEPVPPPPVSHDAFGYVDGVYPVVGGVRVIGWAMDPDMPTGPIAVHVYRDANIFVEALLANVNRPGINAAYPGYGDNHGFDGYAPIPAGSHTVCSYAVNVYTGNAITAIGCRTVVVPARTINEPLGSLDVFTISPGGATIKGWVIDPDTVAASTVQIWSDLTYVTTLTANTSRPDVGAAYPGYGNNHGYDSFVNLPAGYHNICVFAINTLAGSAHPLLSCRQGTISPPPPPTTTTSSTSTSTSSTSTSTSSTSTSTSTTSTSTTSTTLAIMPLDPPLNPAATLIGPRTARVTWTRPLNDAPNASPIVGYTIEVNCDPCQGTEVAGNPSEAIVTGLSPLKSPYVFVVTARNERGQTSRSVVSAALTVPPDKYAAIGDSYSSGEGTFDDEGECQQSPGAYGPFYSVFLAPVTFDLTFTACTGKTTDHLVDVQLPLVPTDAGLITLTTGGNDVGFGGVLTYCAFPGGMYCNEHFETLEEDIDNMQTELVEAYEAILHHAQDARVVVLSYPQVLGVGHQLCYTDMTIDEGEKAWVRERTAQMQEVITAAVQQVGDPRLSLLTVLDAFAGHEICSDEEFANGTSVESPNSFHPNSAGHEKLAAELKSHLAEIGWYS